MCHHPPGPAPLLAVFDVLELDPLDLCNPDPAEVTLVVKEWDEEEDAEAVWKVGRDACAVRAAAAGGSGGDSDPLASWMRIAPAS